MGTSSPSAHEGARFCSHGEEALLSSPEVSKVSSALKRYQPKFQVFSFDIYITIPKIIPILDF